MLPNIRYFAQRRAKKNLILAVRSLSAVQNGKDENKIPIGQGKHVGLTATQEAITNLDRIRKYSLICLIKIVLNGLYLQ